MFHLIETDTADELWIEAAHLFLDDGAAQLQSSRSGATAEILHSALTIRNPRQRWIGSRAPAINPAFAIAEVVWIMGGRNDSAFLNYFNPKLPEFQGAGETYHGAYGFRLRQHLGLDQLDQAFKALQSNSESRQVVLQIWDSRVDLPQEDGRPRSEDIPCNIVALLKIRFGRLEWTQIMRSNDLFRGLPHNIIQFTTLQEVFAGWLGVEVGAYHHYSDSLHFYEKDGSVRDMIKPVKLPENSDSLSLSRGASDEAFKRVSDFVDRLIHPSTTASQILGDLRAIAVPESFQNLAAIMAADALRRRKAAQEMTCAMNVCSNSCLRLLFERWLRRMG